MCVFPQGFTKDIDNYKIYFIYHLCFTCMDFYDLSAWDGCWFVVYIRRFIYKFYTCVLLITRLLRGMGRFGP